MADSKLELALALGVDKANQSIKSVNASLSSMEKATEAARPGDQVFKPGLIAYNPSTAIALFHFTGSCQPRRPLQ